MLRPSSKQRTAFSAREAGLAYLLLLPSALIIGTFGFLPLLNALLVSFRDWRSGPGPWIGLANYGKALTAEPELWQSLGVTGYFVLGTVPATLLLGYLVAELLHARVRGLGLFRALFFLPYVVSPVAAAAVWRWILNPGFGVANAVIAPLGVHSRWLQESTGVFRLAGTALHLPVPAWAAGPSVALVCIMAFTVWQGLGFAVVVLLAGLASVPGEVVDAARVDGASGWSLMRFVKLPLLSPTLFLLLIVFTIRAFQTFTQVYILSPDHGGGPDGTTRTLTLYIIQSFWDNSARLGAGYGSAVAVLLFGLVLALTLIQFRVAGRQVHYR